MNKNEPIEIIPACNGFIVRPGRIDRHGYVAPEETIVFESMAGLCAWLQAHYTHLSGQVFKDADEHPEISGG